MRARCVLIVLLTYKLILYIKWPFGGVVGHWIVDFGEDECLAYWGKISDKVSHKLAAQGDLLKC